MNHAKDVSSINNIDYHSQLEKHGEKKDLLELPILIFVDR